jgi:ATP-dependent helicase/nuclease subunit A
MIALLETGVRPHDLDSAFFRICLHEDVEFPAGDGQCPDPKAAWKALERFWKELQRYLPDPIDPETTCKIQQAALKYCAQLRVARRHLDRPSVIASLLETWKTKSEIIQKHWADTAAEKKKLKKLIPALQAAFVAQTADPYLAHWRQYVYRLAVGLLTRARDHAAGERRRLNTLNYGDLLILAARVLRENAAVRHALQRKYRFLFVDEFQDTDPIQAEIVFLLAAEEGLAPALSRTDAVVSGFSQTELTCDWRTVALRPGALFVVGDPKQSIYRFRRADIEIYNIVRARYEELGGRVLPLTRNYRSVPALCNWANTVFKTRFPEEPTAYSPKFAALEPPEKEGKASASKANRSPDAVFTLTHGSKQAASVAQDDAKAIARYIRAEVDAGRRKYSDFLILTRKKAARIIPYAAALEELDVPIEVSGAGAFGESVDVATLRTLLRSLADPQNELSLLAVLRGPLFGISDRGLFIHRQSGGRFSILAEESGTNGLDSNPAAPVRAALTALRQYYRWTRLLPAAAALDRILEHTGYLALASTMPGGVEAGDLLHAVDRVRQVVEEGGSLADAADSLEEDAEETSEVESLPLEPGRTDVVRVMNLHKAKGLEANVVFLADPLGGFEPRVDVHIERTGARALGWFQIVWRSDHSYATKVLGEHADWQQHQAAEQPYLDREQDRLFYVAATRARELLVISRWTGNARTPAWAVFDCFVTDAPELPLPAQITAHSDVLPDCSTIAQAEAYAARVAALDRVNHPSWSITSVTTEARHVAHMVEQAEPASDDPTRVVGTDTPTHRADAGMAWGTLIHGLLEHAMHHETATRDDLCRLAIWLTIDEPQLRKVIDEAVETVQHVAQAEFWRTAKAGKHLEEAPFAIANGSALTNGVIDLLFKTADGWRIRDYKTDLALTQEAYERQLSAYASALRQLGCEVNDVAIVSVRQK